MIKFEIEVAKEKRKNNRRKEKAIKRYAKKLGFSSFDVFPVMK